MGVIDKDLQVFLQRMQEDWKQYPPFDSMPVTKQREVAGKVRAQWTQGGPVMAGVSDGTFSGSVTTMPYRIYVPTGTKWSENVIIYLHGGGFTLFSINTHDRLMREYAQATQAVVIGLDYPLSPENKFPIALDVIVEFILDLQQHSEKLGLRAHRVALGGDSAGANLSLAACLRLRDLGKIDIICGILANYGAYTSVVSDDAEARFGGVGSIMDRGELEQYFANYFRSSDDEFNPLACPAHANFSGFPPVMNVVPQCDILTEQAIKLDQRLREDGVATKIKIYDGAMHSFLEAMSISPLAREAIGDGASFLRSILT